MECFEDLVLNYLKNKQDTKLFKKLLENAKTKKMISSLKYELRKNDKYVYFEDKDIEANITISIYDVLKKANNEEYKKIPYLREAVRRNATKILEEECLNDTSLDELSEGDKKSGKDLLSSENNNTSIGGYGYKDYQDNIIQNDGVEFLNNLMDDGIKDEKVLELLLDIKYLDDLDECRTPREIIEALNLKHDKAKYKEGRLYRLIANYYSKSKTVERLLRNWYSFIDYSVIIEYLLSENNKKLKIPELIIDFNKLRNYLSVLMRNENINNRTSLMKECRVNVSSYEKDVHRILSLFHKTGENIFKIRNELKQYSPNEFSKVYDIHTATNLVTNYLLLHMLKKYEGVPVKLATITDELFGEIGTKKEKLNFRKYNMLPRLEELKEYGFVSIENDMYSLSENAKFLTEEQKKLLKYVVPFFCGLYPLPSVGHFLASRLDLEDLFRFEDFNVVNILDDCITFDLLNAVNSKKAVTLKIKNEKDKIIRPSLLLIDGKQSLLVADEKGDKVYLNEIEEVKYSDKPKNTIFSEIYSCYYKIFEKIVNKNSAITDTIRKYAPEDALCNKKCKNEIENVINEVLPKLSMLKKIAIPLTTLELKWLKTIMQDERFDLFMSDSEKDSLNILVEKIEPFDLSSFKTYDSVSKRYKNINDAGLPKGTDKELFRKKINELNSALFSIQENKFKVIDYRNT